MVELRVLHFTDLHEDVDKLKAIHGFMKKKGSIDAVFETGDLTGSDGKGEDNYEIKLMKSLSENSELKQLDLAIDDFLKSNGIKSKEELVKKLDSGVLTDRDLFMNLYNRKYECVVNTVLGLYKDSIDAMRPYLQDIKREAKHFVGIAGNHDLSLIYRSLEDTIEFVDAPGKSGTTVAGRSGKSFSVKGMINSRECSRLTHDVLGSIPGIYTEKESGSPGSGEQKKEKERIGEAPDIMLFHKMGYPREHFSDDKHYDDLRGSDLAEEYAKKAGSFGGHFHSPEILVINGKLHVNPGTEHIALVDYNEDKEIEKVEMYRINKAA